MVLEEAIARAGDRLTENDRQIVAQLVRDRETAAAMSSTELAAWLHTSRTTLNRITRKLGLNGFAELKYLLVPVRLTEQQGPNLADIAQGYRTLIQDLSSRSFKQACELIAHAQTVYLYGTGNEQKALAQEFARVFSHYGVACVELFDLGEIRLSRTRMREDDLLVVISLSGESPEALAVVREVQPARVRTLSITRIDNNSLARICDANLFAGTIVVQNDQSLSYELIASFYILLDILALNFQVFRGQNEGSDAT